MDDKGINKVEVELDKQTLVSDDGNGSVSYNEFTATLPDGYMNTIEIMYYNEKDSLSITNTPIPPPPEEEEEEEEIIQVAGITQRRG